MEFLVHIEIRLPEAMPEGRRAELAEAERRRGRELIEQGLLVRIWRLPGRTANVSLYRAATRRSCTRRSRRCRCGRTCDVRVEALAVHPLESRGLTC